MPIYEITKLAITEVKQTTFADSGLDERFDLQRLLRESIDIIAPNTLVIGEELCEWDESRRRIDLLAIDTDANLVVIELKRTEDGGHMELQSIRYAAMISAMSFSQAVGVYSRYLRSRSIAPEEAESRILKFLDWDTVNEKAFGEAVRIILVSADFSKEITTSVLWLNQHDLDIRCVRLRPYTFEQRVLLDVQQVIPLPEAQSYIVQIGKKEKENQTVKKFEPDFTKYDLVINGTVTTGLTKRALVFEVFKAALKKGIPPDKLGEHLPASKWICVDGELDDKGFMEAVAKVNAKLGGKYDLRRYFCDTDELFRVNGKTYALSNQWAIGTITVVDDVIAHYPEINISYDKSSD